MVGSGFFFVLLLVFVAFLLFLYVVVVRKAGYSGWWALLMLVPLINLVMIWVFAFAAWPRLKPPAEATPSPAPPGS